MSFMQQQITHGHYFACETDQGTEYVPADITGLQALPEQIGAVIDEDHPKWPAMLAALYPYCMGTIVEVTPKTGGLARMSAPGFLDCTDWSPFDSEEAAVDGLSEMYGDDDDEQT